MSTLDPDLARYFADLGTQFSPLPANPTPLERRARYWALCGLGKTPLPSNVTINDVTLDLDGTVSPKDVVTTEAGDAVGEVKSAAIAPSNGKAVAIAMVKFAQSTPGTALRVGERHGTVRASERATASERA